MELLYATVIICWAQYGCLLGTSYNNPFTSEEACKKEVGKMLDESIPALLLQYGPTEYITSKCMTKEELDATTGDEGV